MNSLMYVLYTSLGAPAHVAKLLALHGNDFILDARPGGMMPDSRTLVERFYSDIWNRRDHSVAENILSAGFRFRGSLGSETVGILAFLAYVDSVHTTLEGYRCIIEELVAGDDRVSARMLFSGRHRAPLFGVPATGRQVSWAGAAFFTIADARIASLWVLGDIEGLKRQLGATGAAPF